MHLKGNDFLKLLDYTPEQIDYLLRLAAQLKAERDLVEHRVAADLMVWVLEERRRVARDLARPRRARVEPRHLDRSRGRLEKTVHQLGRRRLACAVLPYEPYEFAGIDLKIKVAHRGAAARVGVGNVSQTHDGRGPWFHGGPTRALCHAALAGARDGGAGGVCGRMGVSGSAVGACGRMGGGNCAVGACGRRGSRGGGGFAQVLDEQRGLPNVQAGLAGLYEPARGKAVRDARYARAVDADAPQLSAMGEHLARRALERYASALHDGDAVRIFREKRDLLLDDDHGDAELPIDTAQRLENHARAGGVERCRGLVENEDARPKGEDGGNGDLLLLPAG